MRTRDGRYEIEDVWYSSIDGTRRWQRLRLVWQPGSYWMGDYDSVKQLLVEHPDLDPGELEVVEE